jgi:hypothetical protein
MVEASYGLLLPWFWGDVAGFRGTIAFTLCQVGLLWSAILGFRDAV